MIAILALLALLLACDVEERDRDKSRDNDPYFPARVHDAQDGGDAQ